MQDKYINRLSSVFFDSDLISTRLVLGLAEFFWCVMLLWPGETFDRPTYTVMANLANEMGWAAIYGISSILQFVIVMRGCFHAPWARVFAMWNASIWIVSVGSMFMSVYPPPAAIGGELAQLALLIAALWIWARPLILERGARRVAD